MKTNLLLPMSKDEKDPFMIGLDRIRMATIFPITPRMDTNIKSIPSVINRNIIVGGFTFTFY